MAAQFNSTTRRKARRQTNYIARFPGTVTYPEAGKSNTANAYINSKGNRKRNPGAIDGTG